MLREQDIRSLKRQELASYWLRYPVYFFVWFALRVYFGYRFKDIDKFRREIWKKLSRHDGPVIWTANHLTFIDSFLIFAAVFPFRMLHRDKLIPWSTPEYRNYYHLGGWLNKRLIRFFMYVCRCIPFLREGDDETARTWRDQAYAKCLRVLREGGAVFTFPEATRARNGWFDASRPKDFLGRLALEAPQASFLCVYLRGEGQILRSVYPSKRETFRMAGDLIPGVLPGETTPRAISNRLFKRISELQNRWFEESAVPKNCGGNDVIDLKAPAIARALENEEDLEERLERILTPRERSYLEGLPLENRERVFWKFIAAKESAIKALAQAGVTAAAFNGIDVDLFRNKAVHLPTSCDMDIAVTADDEDKIHCLCVLRGGHLGDDHTPGDVLWEIQELPPGRSPSDFAREKLLDFIVASSDDIPSPDVLAIDEENGIPRVLRNGRVCDWGVSLSHSGRYVAYSFMAS